MDFFIADTHFSHENIITYCGRPFKDAAEMDEYMIKMWNDAVGPNDRVFHLGDFVLAGTSNVEERIRYFTSRLNGYKILVKGNHDRRSDDIWISNGFDEFYTKPLVYGEKYLLSHKPKTDTQYFNLHGHTHNSELPECMREMCFCVSVELINYRPISIARIESLIGR